MRYIHISCGKKTLKKAVTTGFLQLKRWFFVHRSRTWGCGRVAAVEHPDHVRVCTRAVSAIALSLALVHSLASGSTKPRRAPAASSQYQQLPKTGPTLTCEHLLGQGEQWLWLLAHEAQRQSRTWCSACRKKKGRKKPSKPGLAPAVGSGPRPA
eukprot:1192320-Rhodomonas_salina.1